MMFTLRSLTLVALLAMLFGLAPSSAQDQPGGEKGEPFGEEEKTQEPELKFFTRRFIKLKNVTEDTVSASLLYRTFDQEKGAWVWAPSEDEPLSIELEPGQQLLVKVNDQAISASRIKIWGSSRSFKWDTNRETPLWTVAEIDNNEHRYKAAAMDTFLYTFSAPEGSDQETIDSSRTEEKKNGEGQGEKSEEPTRPAEGETTSPSTNEATAGGETAPSGGTGGTDDGGASPGGSIGSEGPGGPGGSGIPLPMELLQGLLGKIGKGKDDQGMDPTPQPKGTDLAAVAFKITDKGDFEGAIQNLGTEEYTSGRRWFVLKSVKGKVDGFKKALAQGDVNALAPNAKQDLSGKLPKFSKTSFYVLVVSPGDDNKKNDSSDVLSWKPSSSKSDLSASVKLLGGKLVGTITNNGPEDYKADAKRMFTLGDKSGVLKPLEGKIVDIAKGKSVDVSLDAKAALKVKTKFFLSLSEGDEKPGNDFADVDNKFKGKGEFGPDLEAKSLVLKGDLLEGTILNNGPGAYHGGRGFFLGNNDAKKSGDIPALKPGASHVVSVKVPKTVLDSFQTFKLNISEIDGKPANDSAKLEHKSKGAPDLTAALKLVGNELKGKITNTGPGVYDGKSRKFKLFHAGEVYQKGVVPHKLKPGEFYQISHKLPPGAPAQTIVLELNKGDANDANDKAEQKFAPTGLDLAVSLKIVGSMAEVKITNVSSEPYAGKRPFTLSRDGVKDLIGIVPGPISPKASRTATYPLNVMTKPGKVTFSLGKGDANPLNDSASAPFMPAVKGIDLAADALGFEKGAFRVTVSNKGTVNYAGGDAYVLTGPGGFKESGKLPPVTPGKPATFPHLPKGALAPGMYSLLLDLKDVDPKNNVATFKLSLTKGLDLAIDNVKIGKDAFAITIVNKGSVPYPGGESYSITGPGAFKESGKLPAIAVGAPPVVVTHTFKPPLPVGSYTVTLHVKGDMGSDNSVVVKHTPPMMAIDLVISNGTFNPKTGTLAFKVSNKGTAEYKGKDGTVISGPGGFKEKGPAIPDLAGGADVTLSYKAPGKLAPGVYTVTLNVADTDKSNNSITIKVAPVGKAELVITSMTKVGKTWTATVQNVGTAPYNSSEGVVFASRYLPKKGLATKNADVPIPNLAPGASFTVPARPVPPLPGTLIEGSLLGPPGAPISPDPSKTKKTI